MTRRAMLELTLSKIPLTPSGMKSSLCMCVCVWWCDVCVCNGCVCVMYVWCDVCVCDVCVCDVCVCDVCVCDVCVCDVCVV